MFLIIPGLWGTYKMRNAKMRKHKISQCSQCVNNLHSESTFPNLTTVIILPTSCTILLLCTRLRLSGLVA